jgi:glycyl-radical enzyme activating protein
MVQTKLTTGILFDIQGFSVHDGPGCRTLIFFKGCSLDCFWCSNPEGISLFREPLYRHAKCTFDGFCAAACPSKAISISLNGNGNQLTINREHCATCKTHDCVAACYSGALNLGGYEIPVDELYNIINRDRQYWGEGGGITLTGGEPFTQPDFAHELLKRCYDAYIHTAVETCGNVPWENIEKSLPFLDWIFFDLKTLHDGQSHKILENARRLALQFTGRLIFRIPIIPGFNDSVENIDKTGRFILSAGRNEVNILALHHLGREKYPLLGRKYYTTDFKIPTSDDLDKIARQFASMGIDCYTGSDTPF